MSTNLSFSKGSGSFILRSQRDANVNVIGQKMKRLLSVASASSVESNESLSKSQKTSDDDTDVEISSLPYSILFKSSSSGDLSQQYNTVLKRTKSETDITSSEEFDYSKLDKKILVKKIMSFFKENNLEGFKAWGEQNKFCSEIYKQFFPKNAPSGNREFYESRKKNDKLFYENQKSHLEFDYNFLKELKLSYDAIEMCALHGNPEIRAIIATFQKLPDEMEIYKKIPKYTETDKNIETYKQFFDDSMQIYKILSDVIVVDKKIFDDIKISDNISIDFNKIVAIYEKLLNQN